jgi:hypothetical protein
MRYKLLGKSFPHDFLVRTRSMVFGESYPLLDDHRA